MKRWLFSGGGLVILIIIVVVFYFTVEGAVAKVDTSEVLGQVKEEMATAKKATEGKGKGAVDTLKNIFGK